MSNTSTTTKTFSIQIGNFKQEYHLWRTKAPRAYDGFGTFTVLESGLNERGCPGEHYDRIVLVPVEHAQWQEMRYCSGHYAPEPHEIDDLIVNYITETLVKRMKEEVK